MIPAEVIGFCPRSCVKQSLKSLTARGLKNNDVKSRGSPLRLIHAMHTQGAMRELRRPGTIQTHETKQQSSVVRWLDGLG